MATRNTVTLEDDVLRLVRAEALRRNSTFRETLNDLVRLGLGKAKQANTKRFPIEPFPGQLRPGISLDSTAKLLEEIEGVWRK